MALPVYVIFGLVAGIIALGFGGDLLFKKTGIPSFLFLILIGIILGPISRIISGQELLPILGTVADLTLIMVIFYSGMDINFQSALGGSARVFLQVLLYVTPSTFVIGLITSYVLHWELIQALIFGSIIGGETTAAVIIPVSRSLRLGEKTTTFLTLEPVISPIFSIVLFTAFLSTYQTGTPNIGEALTGIASTFSVGIVIGGILSLAWIYLLNFLKDYKFTYVLTLGLLFATYSITTSLGGSGVLSCLVFGLMLGSYKLLNRLFKTRQIEIDPLEKQLVTFQGEISFLLETFFFVFLGLTFSINPQTIVTDTIIGISILMILLSFRTIATTISTKGSDFQKDRKKIILMCAQGLTPATLAIVAVNAGLPLGDTFLELVTYVIILTNVVTTAGSIWITRKLEPYTPVALGPDR
jgi:potassium/hydrogen antiporter